MTRFYCSNPDCSQRWTNFAGRPRAKSARCRKCGQPATLLKRVPRGVRVGVIPDFPEHYNWSMGCRVKNRAHHRRIQKERGLMDWEPCRNSPGSQLTLDRLRRTS